MLKLGSLFDGSGGFPLAGAIHGITPAWAAEIEPYPIRVTKARFPQMKHLGSVLDVNGAEVEPVGIITFGSPCQDLSVAGKQAGLLKGERSNLFFEAIRIIKEMREATNGTYPRIAVWENVPGAYSSNKGEDFRAVLQAFCSVKDETTDVPRPAAGKWNPAGTIVGNGWSVAWRTFDAQYWGVPQRRKRIYLIADFGSERAGEILFEQEGLRGDSAESGTAGQSAADNAEGSAGGSGGAVAFDCRHIKCDADRTTTLQSKPQGWDLYRQDVVCYPVGDAEGSVGGSVFNESGKGYWMPGCGCLRAEGENRPSRPGHIVCFKERAGCPGGGKGILCGDKPFTLSTLTDQAVCYAVDGYNSAMDENAATLGVNCGLSTGRNGVVYPIDLIRESRVSIREDGIVPTLSSRMGTGGNNGPMVLEVEPVVYAIDHVITTGGNCTAQGPCVYKDLCPTEKAAGVHAVCYPIDSNQQDEPSNPPRRYIIRRLTPLECCRLQGFPDYWCSDLGIENPTEEDISFWSEVWETHRKIIGTSKKPKSRKQIIKWLQNPHSDSAEYKMWGNGIALPNAAHVVGCAVKLIKETQE